MKVRQGLDKKDFSKGSYIYIVLGGLQKLSLQKYRKQENLEYCFNMKSGGK